ncbi:hypothetical protein B0H34DRAFT_714036 [Crassisporium funariophilum]|nr:hypothetical protein B0H34DRAFT_714036 [Crassisporium funariophilum]
MYLRYYLPLNKSTLIFFRPSFASSSSDSSELERNDGHVVQVTLKQAQRDPVKELTTAFVSQHEITKAVESIIFAHIFTSLPKSIHVEGRGYVLHGTRKPWEYGKKLSLKWGQRTVTPCEDKWTFVLEISEGRDMSPDSSWKSNIL